MDDLVTYGTFTEKNIVKRFLSICMYINVLYTNFVNYI